MNKSLLILALETLREQVIGSTDWSSDYTAAYNNGQKNLDELDRHIELLKKFTPVLLYEYSWIISM